MKLSTIYQLLENTSCKVVLLYSFWIILHYVCSHLYVHWCVPATIYGFLLSPFLAPAPHCQAFRWVISQGGNIIVTMWIVIGTWAIQYLIPSFFAANNNT
jgi:hypothetical protein